MWPIFPGWLHVWSYATLNICVAAKSLKTGFHGDIPKFLKYYSDGQYFIWRSITRYNYMGYTLSKDN